VLQTLSFSLPAIARLGVDALALSAAFTAPARHHGWRLAFGRPAICARCWEPPRCKHATLACVACSSPSGLAATPLAGMGIGGIAANAVALAVDMAPDEAVHCGPHWC
jgi:hypothetical protein